MRLLILGTGDMAAEHARHFAAIEGVTLAGAVEPNLGSLADFCATHKLQFGFSTLDAALARNAFDAIASATPDALHHASSLQAINLIRDDFHGEWNYTVSPKAPVPTQ